MDEQVDQIMDRIRQRQSQLIGETKENEDVIPEVRKNEQVPQSPTKVFGVSKTNINEEPRTPGLFKPAEPKDDSPPKSAAIPAPEQTSTRKARFSQLAQELDNFECDFQTHYNKPKEAYMKGRSPRLSIGETRPSVLCTPAGAAALRTGKTPPSSKSSSNVAASSPPKVSPNKSVSMEIVRHAEFEDRRIKFAHPLVNVNYLTNESASGSSVNDTVSTVLGGSSEMMNVTTSSLSCDFSIDRRLTIENTIINSQTCDNRDEILRQKVGEMPNASSDYGAHTFMRAKPRTTTTVVEPNETLTELPKVSMVVGTPKPFSRETIHSKYSPVHFNPKSTSSPKLNESTMALSPAKSAALESARAKTIRDQFEQKVKESQAPAPAPAPIPTPRHPIGATPHHHVAPHQKTLFQPEREKDDVHTPTLPGGVQTQWRGQHNTPVVKGARAEEPTVTDIVGPGQSKLKNLRSRWEFSSATGTPIHPDATEDSLIAAAIKMKETALPKKIATRRGNSQSSVPQVRSVTASPAAKNQRYDDEVLEDDVFEDDVPESNQEYDPVCGDEGEISGDELASTDASRIIDQAFDFMERGGSKMGTPSPYRPSLDGSAPIAQSEDISLRKRVVAEIIEEEDVPMGDDDEEEEEVERTIETTTTSATIREESHIEREWNERKNESRLPYSVSFYRKIQKERVATVETPKPVEPSAPMPLTSAHVLKQLTSGAGESSSSSPLHREFEDVESLKKRLRNAIKVEEEHISQSRRALTLCRQTDAFRGSREEIEMQRALLIAIERQRALLGEYERVQRDGPRIIEGPRGDVTLSQLQVNLSRDFVQMNIASARKSPEVYYFVAVLKWGEQVEVSKLVPSDAAMNRKGALDFPMPLQLKSIPPDFKAIVEIYGQRTQRECISHEDKYKLKGATLKSKVSFAHRALSKGAENQSMYIPPSSSSSTVGSCFNMLGSFTFDINTPSKKAIEMCHPIHPLDGAAMIKLKKRAVEGVDIVHKGFLSMYQRTREGLGSWTRYWCVLDGGEMKFWRHPEDEGQKNWLVLLDLATCIRSDGASTVSDICPYPNSFHIDVWVPKEDAAVRPDATLSSPNDIEQLRVMLAADTPADLTSWLSVINSSSRQLCTWRNPIF
ncbi:unnamed protein product [Caenorhabditis bovis]|uniref:PH domain-containing protein n=1 Tax=Caenorhabditis bovis TaxID=2654633 RepID=A0A8S1EIR3_9PELO|nr:unnamed protein product [Caenorhabditis bovis]